MTVKVRRVRLRVKGFAFWLFLSLLLAVGISWSYIIGLTPNNIKQVLSSKSVIPEDHHQEEIQEVIVPHENEKSVTDFFSYVKGEASKLNYPGVDEFTRYTVKRLGVRPLKTIEPLRPDLSGPVINDVTSFNYPIQMNPCRPKSPGTNRSVFVTVISAPKYFKKRRMIRETWAKHLRLQGSDLGVELLGMAFMVGQTKEKEVDKKLRMESKRYGDILQVGMMDGYYNITLKVAGLLNWLRTNCNTADFVLKVDDDIYVNSRNLASTLTSLSPTIPALYGSQMPLSNLEPERMGDGKWSISYESWPWIVYPNFLRGASVLMTRTAIVPLLAGFQTTPLFPFDDVFLSGMISRKTNVKVFSNDWFVDVFPLIPPDPCQIFDTISFLTTSSKEMKSFHSSTELFYAGFKPCWTDYENSAGSSDNQSYDKNRNTTLQSTAENSLVNPTDLMEFTFQEVPLNDNFLNFTAHVNSSSPSKTDSRWIFVKKSN